MEALGLLKMDFLGLRTLTIADTVRHVRASHGTSIWMLMHYRLSMMRKHHKCCVMEIQEQSFQMESAGMTNLVRICSQKGALSILFRRWHSTDRDHSAAA